MNLYLTLPRRFVEVVEAGSVQNAALALNLSQPALTQSIKKIEQAFNCQLFERTRQGMTLTSAGERLYLHSKRMLAEGSLAELEITDLIDGRSGALRIAAGTAWGYCFLPPIIRDLQARFGDLKVELDIALTEQALPRLLAGEVDVVLGASDSVLMDDPSFSQTRLMELDIAAACGVGSPLYARQRVDLPDFADVPIIVYADDEQLMQQVIGRIEQTIGTTLDIAVRTKSLLATMELVSTGPYVVFLAKPFLQKFAQQGIHVLPVEGVLYSFPTAAYYRKSLTKTRPFQQFLILVEQLART